MNKKQDYQIISERIDDIVLLLSVMKQMKLPELIDDYLPRHWNQQRLETATAKIKALTPSPGRGKRQIREESILQQKVQAIVKTHRVEGWLHFSYEYQPSNSP